MVKRNCGFELIFGHRVDSTPYAFDKFIDLVGIVPSGRVVQPGNGNGRPLFVSRLKQTMGQVVEMDPFSRRL